MSNNDGDLQSTGSKSETSVGNLDKDYHDLLDDIRQTLAISETGSDVKPSVPSSSGVPRKTPSGKIKLKKKRSDISSDDDDVLPPAPELDLSLFETELTSNDTKSHRTGTDTTTGHGEKKSSKSSRNNPPSTVVSTIQMVRDTSSGTTQSKKSSGNSNSTGSKLLYDKIVSSHPQPPTPKPQHITAPEVNLLPLSQASLPILLVSTNRASKLVRQNNVTISELFTTFANNLPAHFQSNPLPTFRSISKNFPMSWDKIKLRFLERSDYDGTLKISDDKETFGIRSDDAKDEIYGSKIVSIEQCQEYLEKYISKTSEQINTKKKEKSNEEIQKEEEETGTIIDTFLSHHYDPWLRRYRHYLDTTTCQSNNDVDMFSHPIIVILIASSAEDYVNCFKELSNVHHFPKAFSNGLFDYSLVKKHFLLLSEEDKEESLLHHLKSAFPSHSCNIIRFNSGSGSEVESIVWMNSTGGRTPRREGKGRWLSNRDKYQLRRFLSIFTSDYVIPALERRIFHLNSIVNNAKRGVKNVFKAFWRKPKNSEGAATAFGLTSLQAEKVNTSAGSLNNTRLAGGGGGTSFYPYDSIESQVRLLGDSLFLVKDYESALAMYRLVKDDYKHDKATYHYASVQEMMAICYYELDPYLTKNPREFQNCIENALYSYTRNINETEEKSAYSHHATRLCLVLSSFIVSPTSASSGTTSSLNQNIDMADLIASTSSHEASFGAAVLLERAAYHYLQSSYIRKFAFHVLMAGHMYRSSHQELHAMRCFFVSLSHYQLFQWPDLVAHLKSALAQQCYTLGNAGTSFLLYWVLLREGGLGSMRSQQRYIQHFVDLARKFPADVLKTIDVFSQLNNENTDNPILEIPNLGIPRVLNDLIRISLEDDFHYRPHVISPSRKRKTHSFFISLIDDGDEARNEALRKTNSVSDMNVNLRSANNHHSILSQGDEKNWNSITCLMEAELLTPEKDLNKIFDKYQSIHDDMIYQHQSQAKNALKTHLFPHYGSATRSKSEPIQLQVVILNPLSVQLQFMEMQLIAELESNESGTVGSNMMPFKAENQDLFAGNTKKKKDQWKYMNYKNIVFEEPAFYQNKMDPDTKPFFIVDKQNIVMEPNVVKRVTFHIVPLEEGKFTIKGFRCKLFNYENIWIRYLFDVKGPLLQNSSYNRANRVRGDSHLLDSKIEHEMPHLQVEFLHLKSFVLQGEITKFVLRVTNVGSAPAHNIYLKMNSPCICFATGNNDHPDQSKSMNFCFGPSGTLMKVPLFSSSGSNATASPSAAHIEGILQPNETVDIPCKLRVDNGGGKQEIYFLFRYELHIPNASTEHHSHWENLPSFTTNPPSSTIMASTDSNQTKKYKKKCRFLRKILPLAVYPSVNMNVSLMPSYWNKNDHLLSIELFNFRSDETSTTDISKLDLFLHTIRVASRYFKVVQVSDQINFESSVIEDQQLNRRRYHPHHPAVLRVGWQECITLHYLIVPIEKTDSVSFSDCHLLPNGVANIAGDDLSSPKAQSSAIMEFLSLGIAHDKFETALEEHRKVVLQLLAEQEESAQPRSIAQIRRANAELSQPNENESPSQKMEKDASISDLMASRSDGLDVDPDQQILESNYHPTSLTSMCPPKEIESTINIITSWSTVSHSLSSSNDSVGNATGSGGKDDILLRGQHHYPQLYVRPKLDLKKNSNDCPLTIIAKHETDILHDFSTGPLVTDLQVTIRNRLIKQKIDFEFTMEYTPEYEILGNESFLWKLKGGEDLTIPYRVIIYSSGVYNLQCVRLTIFSGSGKEAMKVPFLFPLQWIMRVGYDERKNREVNT